MAMKFEVKEPVIQRSKETSTSVENFDPFSIFEVPATTPSYRYMTPDLLALSIRDIPYWESIVREHALDTNAASNPSKQATDFPYEVPSRLEHSLNLHTALRMVENYFETSYSKEESSSKSTLSSGHRVIVGNLSTSVTKSVVQELFKDIGELIYVRRAHITGIAEVIYKSLEDAQKAVKTYHNRHLNGQPMKCLLVNFRGGAAKKSTALAISSLNLQSPNEAPKDTVSSKLVLNN